MLLMVPPSLRGRRLLSTGGVARIVGCDTATVRRAIVRGELEAVRLGRRGDYRVPVQAIDEWLRHAHRGDDPCE